MRQGAIIRIGVAGSKLARLGATRGGGAAAAAVLLLVVALAGIGETRAQTTADGSVIKYFLDAPPAALDPSRLPSAAREVTVAKVRIVAIAWRGGRHPWDLPPPPVDASYGVELEIIDVLRGKVTAGTRHTVLFGIRGANEKYVFPHRWAYARDYFVVSYFDASGWRRLVGFPATEEEYQTWERELLQR